MNRKNLRKQSAAHTRTALILLLLAAASTLLPTACSPLPDDEPTPAAPGNGGNGNDNNNDTPVTLSIGNVSIEGAQGATRANTIVKSGSLWVGCSAGNGYSADADGIVYDYDRDGDGTWQTAYFDTKRFVLNSSPIPLYAYYPYDYGGSNPPIKTQPYSESAELYYATAPKSDVNITNPTANFVMKHAYARLRLCIQVSAGFTETSNITKLHLEYEMSNQIYMEGKFNVKDGVAMDRMGESGVTYNPNATLVPGEMNTQCDVLIVPQEFRKVEYEGADHCFVIQLTIGGKYYEFKIHENEFNSEFKPNTQYNIYFQMNSDATLTRGKVTVEPWTTETLPEIIDPIEPK